MRAQMAARLIEEYGSPQSRSRRGLGAGARERLVSGRRGGRALSARRPETAKAPANKAALELLVAWHGEPLGRLTHDGFEWRWKPHEGPPLVRQTTPGKLPAFIESLLPEGWLAQVLHQRDEREALRSRPALYVEHRHRQTGRNWRPCQPSSATPLAAYAPKGGSLAVRRAGARGDRGDLRTKSSRGSLSALRRPAYRASRSRLR